ncbi:hypothetical protein D9M68_885910 [compost metagenome]
MSSLVLPDCVCAHAGIDSPRVMTASEPSANRPGALSKPRRRASGSVRMVPPACAGFCDMRSMVFSCEG